LELCEQSVGALRNLAHFAGKKRLHLQRGGHAGVERAAQVAQAGARGAGRGAYLRLRDAVVALLIVLDHRAICLHDRILDLEVRRYQRHVLRSEPRMPPDATRRTRRWMRRRCSAGLLDTTLASREEGAPSSFAQGRDVSD
jgi:hypothetical protein